MHNLVPNRTYVTGTSLCYWEMAAKTKKTIYFINLHERKWLKSFTVEPRYNEDLNWDHENYLIITGFSYQGKKTKKYKEMGPAKLPC